MSLQYEKEPEQTETPAEQDENVQQAQLVFPIYSFILIACLVAVSLCQFSVDGSDSILFGGDTSALLAGFDKSTFAG